MTVYVDADHTHDLVTRGSVTGILVMLNNMAIRWISKSQQTVTPQHSRTVLLILKPMTGLVSPQFHVKSDKQFQTVK
jgi:hypothetical protein